VTELLSHLPSDGSIDLAVAELKQKIEAAAKQTHTNANDQLHLVDQLASFALGRFLIINRGMNGFWTHYVTTYPRTRQSTADCRTDKMSALEKFLLEDRPMARATQERFEIFLKLAQSEVKNDAVLASIPCGLMADLLFLDYSSVQNISLIGIDLDGESIEQAKQLACRQGLEKETQFFERDAWNLGFANQFSLVMSSGLNIYEPDEQRLLALYKGFYDSLKAYGTLLTSFFTPPPWIDAESPWDLNQIDEEALRLQKTIYSDILAFKAVSYVFWQDMKKQLETVGFKQIEITYDRARIFPTVRAKK
jgi:hypothetical protein